MLRITVKAIGDHSAALRGLKPGVKVWAEGPYGAMTASRRSRGKVLLVAGGVGITPMRALFETLPGAAGDITLLYRANSTQDLALWDELAEIADERGARLMYAVNSPDGERPDISAESLRRKLPDIESHDVFMCGPTASPRACTRHCAAPGSRPAVSTTSRSRCERRPSRHGLTEADRKGAMKKSHPLRRVVLATAATVSGIVLLLSLKPASDPGPPRRRARPPRAAAAAGAVSGDGHR